MTSAMALSIAEPTLPFKVSAHLLVLNRLFVSVPASRGIASPALYYGPFDSKLILRSEVFAVVVQVVGDRVSIKEYLKLVTSAMALVEPKDPEMNKTWLPIATEVRRGTCFWGGRVWERGYLDGRGGLSVRGGRFYALVEPKDPEMNKTWLPIATEVRRGMCCFWGGGGERGRGVFWMGERDCELKVVGFMYWWSPETRR